MPKLDPADKAVEIQERERLARESWAAHARSEKRSGAIAAGAFAALALLGWGCYLAWGPGHQEPMAQGAAAGPAPARQAPSDPAGALSGRKPPPLNPAAVAAIGRSVIKPSAAPPARAVALAKPKPMDSAKGSVAPVEAPSKEAIARAMPSGPASGRSVLAVDAQGFAALPDGRRVKVALAAPDPGKAKQAILAKEQAAQFAAPSLAGAQVDGNGIKRPVGLAEASQRARIGASGQKSIAMSMPDRASAPIQKTAARPASAMPQQMDGGMGLGAGIAVQAPARQRSDTTMK